MHTHTGIPAVQDGRGRGDALDRREPAGDTSGSDRYLPSFPLLEYAGEGLESTSTSVTCMCSGSWVGG